MKDLNEAREKLNDIDDKMKKLFIDRMNVIKEVALYKKANNMEIYDENREKTMFDRLGNDLDELKPYYFNFLKSILKESKDYQKEIVK